ncbi:MAG: hypothetical protein AB1657_02175 [Candidatus Micrarchaeota archaeon]
MMSTRITITLDEIIVRKLKELGHGNVSAFINEQLKKCLFEKKESMAGVLAGKVSMKDIKEDEEHEIRG